MRFSDILDTLADDGEALRCAVPESWAQGRTAYGGLTAALCARAAGRRFADLPPMRSAQIAFVGPLAGEVTIRARLLRRGRSTGFLAADATTGEGMAARCLFVHGEPRRSAHTLQRLPMPDVPGFARLADMTLTPFHPAFTAQFQSRIARGGLPFSGTGEAQSFWWARHRDEAARGTAIGLLCLADLTPPAIAPTMAGLAPVSSVTWQFDVLTDDLSTEEGWYLLMTSAEAASDGWSGQAMAVWSSDGRPVGAGRQSVAVFA